MKRIRYILLAFAVTLSVSCTKHDTDSSKDSDPARPDSYIFFEPGLLDVVESKAELITALPQTDGTAFGVLGFYEDNNPIFDKYTDNIAEVYRESGIYKYENLAPWLGSTHTFHAFYPYSALVVNVKVGTDNVPYVDYTQPWNASDMIDILGAWQQVKNTNEAKKPVNLALQHLLWAFKLEMKNSQTYEINGSVETENPYITINEITLGLKDFPSSARLGLDKDFTVTPGTTATGTCVLYSGSGEQIANGGSKEFGPLLFIPVTSLQYQLTIKYTTQGGYEDTYVYPAEGQYKTVSASFERGKGYTITIDKKNDKFFVGLEPGEWNETNVEHTFE